MTNSKFKVGDKVRVIRKAKTHERGWENSWVFGMDEYVGKVFVIKGNDCGAGYSLSSKVNNYNFPEFVLEPEIKIGEQMEFEFMLED